MNCTNYWLLPIWIEEQTLSLEDVFAMTQNGIGARAPSKKNHLRFLYSPVVPSNLEDPTRPHNVMTEKVLAVTGHDHAPDSTHMFPTPSNNQYAQARFTSPANTAPHTCKSSKFHSRSLSTSLLALMIAFYIRVGFCDNSQFCVRNLAMHMHSFLL